MILNFKKHQKRSAIIVVGLTKMKHVQFIERISRPNTISEVTEQPNLLF